MCQGIATPAEIAAALPMVQPPPAVAGIPQGFMLTAAEAAMLEAISRKVGPLFILHLRRWVQEDGRTILELQA